VSKSAALGRQLLAPLRLPESSPRRRLASGRPLSVRWPQARVHLTAELGAQREMDAKLEGPRDNLSLWERGRRALWADTQQAGGTHARRPETVCDQCDAVEDAQWANNGK